MVCVAQYFWPNIYTADFFSVDNKMRYIDLYSSAYCIQLSCKILAFALVLICFRALEYLSISPRLHQISATFSHSLKNIAVRNVIHLVVSVMVFSAWCLLYGDLLDGLCHAGFLGVLSVLSDGLCRVVHAGEQLLGLPFVHT